MDYIKAKEIMDFLQAQGVNAEFHNDSETIIDVHDDEGMYLFDVTSPEEWQEIIKVMRKVVAGLVAKEPEQP